MFKKLFLESLNELNLPVHIKHTIQQLHNVCYENAQQLEDGDTMEFDEAPELVAYWNAPEPNAAEEYDAHDIFDLHDRRYSNRDREFQSLMDERKFQSNIDDEYEINHRDLTDRYTPKHHRQQLNNISHADFFRQNIGKSIMAKYQNYSSKNSSKITLPQYLNRIILLSDQLKDYLNNVNSFLNGNIVENLGPIEYLTRIAANYEIQYLADEGLEHVTEAITDLLNFIEKNKYIFVLGKNATETEITKFMDNYHAVPIGYDDADSLTEEFDYNPIDDDVNNSDEFIEMLKNKTRSESGSYTDDHDINNSIFIILTICDTIIDPPKKIENETKQPSQIEQAKQNAINKLKSTKVRRF